MVCGAGEGISLMSSLGTAQLPETDSQVTGARCGGRMLINIDRTFSDGSPGTMAGGSHAT